MTTPTGILRYPYEAITDTTDYLQLTIKSYPGTESLIEGSNFGTNQSAFDVSNTAASSLKPAQLSKDGVIILPMPSNIEDSNSVSYDGDSLNTLTATALKGVTNLMGADIGKFIKNPKTAGLDDAKRADLGDVAGKIFSQDVKDLVMAQLAVQAVNIFGANTSIQSLLSRSEGKILNPNMELLFNNVTLRTFRFSFKMTPRDEVESMQVKSIIRSLKKNMAAKKVDTFFLETPNIFELEYKKGPKLHPFLHRFKQCALSDMSVNYTGENVYATYSDGTPVSIILNLTFKELVPIYEGDYDDDAFNSGSDTDYKDNQNALATAMDYGVDGQGPNGVQRNVEGVGY